MQNKIKKDIFLVVGTLFSFAIVVYVFVLFTTKTESDNHLVNLINHRNAPTIDIPPNRPDTNLRDKIGNLMDGTCFWNNGKLCRKQTGEHGPEFVHLE